MLDMSTCLVYIDVILIISVILGSTFKFLRLSPVLGYFISGALIAKVIEPGNGINIFAEFGIVFLLFVIGLELTLKRLIGMSKHVFGFGGLQVIITTVVFAFIMHHWYKYDQVSAFIVGSVFAMSSTAIVLQILQSTNRQLTPVGRLALADLIFQDLAVIPLLVLVPLLNKGSAFMHAISLALAKGFAVLLIIFVMGRLLLRPVFRMIVSLSSQELFLSSTILIILGTSYLTEYVGLSMALGAFVAGLLMAETEYRDEVEQVVMPFKSLLLGLYFMTVGMSINFDMMIQSAREIVVLAAIIISVKASIIYVLCRLFNFKVGQAIQAGLLLAQGGEFAFILLGLASDQKILSSSVSTQLMMVVTFTMAITPLLVSFGNKIADKLTISNPTVSSDIVLENADLKHHVIIAGFGNFGKTLARVLALNNIYYVAFDINNQLVTDGKNNGYVVYKGDATRPDIYETLAIKKSLVVVVTVGNPITANKAIGVIQDNFPNANIKTHVLHMESAQDMIIKNKDDVYASDLETAIKISSHIILSGSDVNPEELVGRMRRIRNAEYNAIGVGSKNKGE